MPSIARRRSLARHSAAFVGLLALAAVVAYFVFGAQREPRVAETVQPERAVAIDSSAELALPDETARASAESAVADDRDVSPRRVAATPTVGALSGRVLLGESFVGARCVALLTSDPWREVVVRGKTSTYLLTRDNQGNSVWESTTSKSTSDDASTTRVRTSEPMHGPAFELAFDELEPGAYELRLAVVRDDYETDPLAILQVEQAPFCTVSQLIVDAGATLRDPRLHPLDLRTKHTLARFTLVDALGAPRAWSRCEALTDREARATAVTDAHGDVDLVFRGSAPVFVELALDRARACVTRSPFALERRVVVVADRPVYVLHVDPDAIPAGVELSIVAREAAELSADSPNGRTASGSRFDDAGDAVLQLRRLGLHELEWRAKRPDGKTITWPDATQTLEARASAAAQFVPLTLPAEVRAAL